MPAPSIGSPSGHPEPFSAGFGWRWMSKKAVFELMREASTAIGDGPDTRHVVNLSSLALAMSDDSLANKIASGGATVTGIGSGEAPLNKEGDNPTWVGIPEDHVLSNTIGVTSVGPRGSACVIAVAAGWVTPMTDSLDGSQVYACIASTEPNEVVEVFSQFAVAGKGCTPEKVRSERFTQIFEAIQKQPTSLEVAQAMDRVQSQLMRHETVAGKPITHPRKPLRSDYDEVPPLSSWIARRPDRLDTKFEIVLAEFDDPAVGRDAKKHNDLGVGLRAAGIQPCEVFSVAPGRYAVLIAADAERHLVEHAIESSMRDNVPLHRVSIWSSTVDFNELRRIADAGSAALGLS